MHSSKTELTSSNASAMNPPSVERASTSSTIMLPGGLQLTCGKMEASRLKPPD